MYQSQQKKLYSFLNLIKVHGLISVVVGLEGSLGGNTQIFNLLGGEGGEASTELLQMETSDLLIQLFGQEVNSDGVFGVLSPEGNLGKNLVRERAGHHKAGVTSGTSQVNKTALSEQDDVSSALELEAVNLGLDVNLGRVGNEPSNVDLNVEVANVAEDSILLHDLHVLTTDDVFFSSQ